MIHFIASVLLSVLFLTWAPNVHAQDRSTGNAGSGFEAAWDLCDRLSSAHAYRCRSIAQLHEYMDRTVVESCSSNFVGDAMLDCLQAGAGRTNPRAAQVCEVFFGSTPSFVRCLQSIAHKELREADITACKAALYGDEIIECFRNRGKVWPRELERSTPDERPAQLPAHRLPPKEPSGSRQGRVAGGGLLIAFGTLSLFLGTPILLIGGLSSVLDPPDKRDFMISGGAMTGAGAILLGIGIPLVRSGL